MKRQQQKHNSTTYSSSNSNSRWQQCWLCLPPLLALASLLRVSQLLMGGNQRQWTRGGISEKGPVNISALEPDGEVKINKVCPHILLPDQSFFA